MPNRNGRGDTLSFALEYIRQFIRREAAIEVNGRLRFIDPKGEVIKIAHARRPRIIARVGDGIEVGEIFGNLIHHVV